jgi:indolepyruvate ferredoxin oxidoreductase beta subunit
MISELLGKAAVKDGLRVRGSEVLGMAVRGGPVSSTIRIGSEVFGPLTPAGRCDILIGMEPAEALRNISYLSLSSLVILNTEAIVPFTVSIGESHYPDMGRIIERLASASSRVVTLSAVQIARQAGSQLSANIVMLGALFGTGRVPVKVEMVKEEIKTRFSAKLVPSNMTAFDLGYQIYRKQAKTIDLGRGRGVKLALRVNKTSRRGW